MDHFNPNVSLFAAVGVETRNTIWQFCCRASPERWLRTALLSGLSKHGLSRRAFFKVNHANTYDFRVREPVSLPPPPPLRIEKSRCATGPDKQTYNDRSTKSSRNSFSGDFRKERREVGEKKRREKLFWTVTASKTLTFCLKLYAISRVYRLKRRVDNIYLQAYLFYLDN